MGKSYQKNTHACRSTQNNTISYLNIAQTYIQHVFSFHDFAEMAAKSVGPYITNWDQPLKLCPDQTKPEMDGCLVVEKQCFNYPEMISKNHEHLTPDLNDIHSHVDNTTSIRQFMSVVRRHYVAPKTNVWSVVSSQQNSTWMQGCRPLRCATSWATNQHVYIFTCILYRIRM